MNWLQALDSIEAGEDMRTVFKAMDKLILGGKAVTYYNISEVSQPHLTEYQIEGLTRRFRSRYQKDKAFTIRAKIIASHFGVNGERKILG